MWHCWQGHRTHQQTLPLFSTLVDTAFAQAVEKSGLPPKVMDPPLVIQIYMLNNLYACRSYYYCIGPGGCRIRRKAPNINTESQTEEYVVFSLDCINCLLYCAALSSTFDSMVCM
jgi:hypothetical protein